MARGDTKKLRERGGEGGDGWDEIISKPLKDYLIGLTIGNNIHILNYHFLMHPSIRLSVFVMKKGWIIFFFSRRDQTAYIFKIDQIFKFSIQS